MPKAFPMLLPLSFRLRRYALTVLLCLLSAAASQGQASMPTASRKADLQVGAGLTVARHDYQDELVQLEDGLYISGATVYATFDFSSHLGAEFNFRQLTSHNADHLTERSYEIGPRYVWHFHRLNPYVRVSYGRGVFNFPFDQANLAYNMFAAGGGVDVNVLRHLNVRADFDYQYWLNFKDSPSFQQHLQPKVGTIGVAYRF